MLHRSFFSLLYLLLGACGTTDPAPELSTSGSDPTLGTMDRILARTPPRHGGQTPEAIQKCMNAAEPLDQCPMLRGQLRTIQIRLALDPQYTTHWVDWRGRLAQTLTCVNRMYQPTGINWSLQSITPWDPKSDRNRLYALLHRLQTDFPPTEDSVALGIVLWDELKVYQSSSGEIGLSQHAACVVPSWPRVENDCLILAHELGHLLGAKHVPGKHWIMGWAASPFHLPAADPVARVVATYRFHPRNIAAINAHQHALFTPGGLALPRACTEKMRRIDRCWNL